MIRYFETWAVCLTLYEDWQVAYLWGKIGFLKVTCFFCRQKTNKLCGSCVNWTLWIGNHGLTCQEKEWLVGLWRQRPGRLLKHSTLLRSMTCIEGKWLLEWYSQCWLLMRRNGISGGEPTWPIRGAWGARSSLQVNLTTCFHRPHICHFFSTNVLLGWFFLHMKIAQILHICRRFLHHTHAICGEFQIFPYLSCGDV